MGTDGSDIEGKVPSMGRVVPMAGRPRPSMSSCRRGSSKVQQAAEFTGLGVVDATSRTLFARARRHCGVAGRREGCCVKPMQNRAGI